MGHAVQPTPCSLSAHSRRTKHRLAALAWCRYASVRSRLSEVRWEVLDLQPKDTLGHPFQAILILPPTTTPAQGAKAGGT